MEKKCFKCSKVKDLSEFYKHKGMADGHLGKCIDCTRRYAIEHRNKNIEKIREYDRRRGKLPHRKKKCVEITRKYRKNYPLRYAAVCLLNNAIRDGKIEKPKRCSMCNRKTKICGHHKDYYKPLEVIWVCQICHARIHKDNNAKIPIHKT